MRQNKLTLMSMLALTACGAGGDGGREVDDATGRANRANASAGNAAATASDKSTAKQAISYVMLQGQWLPKDGGCKVETDNIWSFNSGKTFGAPNLADGTYYIKDEGIVLNFYQSEHSIAKREFMPIRVIGNVLTIDKEDRIKCKL